MIKWLQDYIAKRRIRRALVKLNLLVALAGPVWGPKVYHEFFDVGIVTHAKRDLEKYENSGNNKDLAHALRDIRKIRDTLEINKGVINPKAKKKLETNVRELETTVANLAINK